MHRRECFQMYKSSLAADDWKKFKQARLDTIRLIRRKKREAWQCVGDIIAKEEPSETSIWRRLKACTRPRQHTEAIRDESGNLCHTDTEVGACWSRHFAGLASPHPPTHADDVFRATIEAAVEGMWESQDEGPAELNRPFSIDEIECVISSLPTRKAPGPDQIPNELLKAGGEAMIHSLTALFNDIWQQEKIPTEWGKGKIIPLFKAGDLLEPGNYRGITLLSCVYKTFARVVNQRLTVWLESNNRISERQAGFRPNRQCADHVYTLDTILRYRRKQKKPTYVCFIDFQKAYDKVWHRGLWYRLWDIGVRGKVWRVLQSIYEVSSSFVEVNGYNGDPFSVDIGVKQGDVLSPTLFNVMIDPLAVDVEGGENGGARIGVPLPDGDILGAQLYADDSVLVAETPDDLQLMLDRLWEFCRKWQFIVNGSKSKVMAFGPCQRNATPFKLGNAELEQVKEYKYLGVWLTSNLRGTRHGQYVVDKCAMRLKALRKWLYHPHIPQCARKLIWSACGLAPALYAVGTWRMNKKHCEELWKLKKRAARHILGCNRHTSIPAMIGDLEWLDVESMLDRRLLLWEGYVRHLPQSRLPKRVVVWAEAPKRKCTVQSLGITAALRELEEGKIELPEYKQIVDSAVLKEWESGWREAMEALPALQRYRENKLEWGSDIATRLVGIN
eukprot:Rmarinus@m.22826